MSSYNLSHEPLHMSFWNPLYPQLRALIKTVQEEEFGGSDDGWTLDSGTPRNWDGVRRCGITLALWSEFVKYARSINKRSGLTIFYICPKVQYAPTSGIRDCYFFHIMRERIHKRPKSEWRRALITYLRSPPTRQLRLF